MPVLNGSVIGCLSITPGASRKIGKKSAIGIISPLPSRGSPKLLTILPKNPSPTGILPNSAKETTSSPTEIFCSSPKIMTIAS